MSVGQLLDKLFEILPMPTNPFEITWTGIGMLLAANFSRVDSGQGLDEYLQQTQTWNEKFNKTLQWFLNRLLHFVHHWWIGMLFVIYCGTTSYYLGMPLIPFPELYWIGFGMFLEDALYHVSASFKTGLLSKITSYIAKINGFVNKKKKEK